MYYAFNCVTILSNGLVNCWSGYTFIYLIISLTVTNTSFAPKKSEINLELLILGEEERGGDDGRKA